MTRFFTSLAALIVVGIPSIVSAQVEIKYKYVAGRTERSVATKKVNQTITLAGMNLDIAGTSETTTTSKEGQKKADGSFPIVLHFDALKSQASFPGGLTLEYDSAKPADNKADPMIEFLVEAMSRVAGKSLTVNIGANGLVKSVEGSEKFLEKSEELKPQAVELLKSMIGAQATTLDFNQKLKRYEPGLVRKGDTWERTEISDQGGESLKFKNKYEYLGTIQKDGKELDEISVKAIEVTYEMDPKAESPLKVVKSDLKVASSEGKILFDRAAGLEAESSSKLHIKGPMTFSIMDNELPGEIDIKMDSVENTTIVK